MTRRLILMFLPLLLLASRCKTDDPIDGSFSLGFRATWGGAPLVMNEALTYSNGKAFKIDKVSFYVSDVTLIGGPNGDTTIIVADFIDLSNLTTTSLAQTGLRLADVLVPPGAYSGIRLGLGLNSTLNAKKPAEFAQGHPMAKPGEYWDGWQSYIFVKVEGRVSTNNDGIYNFGFAYHTGSDEVFRTKSVALPIGIDANKSSNLTGVIDVQKLLNGIDLTDQTGGHTIGDIGLATILMNNFAETALIFE